MKFVSIRDFRNKTASIRKALATEHEILVTSNGRPFAARTRARAPGQDPRQGQGAGRGQVDYEGDRRGDRRGPTRKAEEAVRVVLDTNVLVSALMTSGGVCSRILRLVYDEALQVCIDERIIEEYESVLSRPRFRLDREDIDETIEMIGRGRGRRGAGDGQ